jgi:hypothetical protein
MAAPVLISALAAVAAIGGIPPMTARGSSSACTYHLAAKANPAVAQALASQLDWRPIKPKDE